MPKINILPKSIAELIAAGEVVERPASVVKELVENSIDAGAKSVAVEIMNGGIRYIRVTDNGCGISPEDVPTAFISHATSKIKDASDLNSILTLGFRGEALPSVAAVSRLSMLTRTEEADEGVLFTVEGGDNAKCEPAGCPVGTTITVRDLFFNTPARMKFLKKDVTEGSCVTDVVTKAALAHPEVKFSLIRDGKNVLLTPGNGRLSDTVYSVFGKAVADALLPCEYEGNGISVSGYISKPLNNRPNRNMQFFFVNGRSVRIPAAVPALDEAYKNSIMIGKFPMCFLNVKIAAEKVDVNVHPAKTEIRFSDETKIFEVIYYAARGALARGDSTRPSIRLANNSVLDAPKQKTEQMSFSSVHRGSSAPQTAFRSSELESREKNGSGTEKQAEPLLKDRANIFDISQGVKPQAEHASASVASGSLQSKEGQARPGAPFVSLPLNDSAVDPIVSSGERRVSSETGYNVPWTTKKTIDVFVDDGGENGNTPSADIRKEEPLPTDNERIENDSVTDRVLNAEEKEESVSDGAAFDDFKIIGEIFKTYILVERASKLLIIDKHAAHERMIFNRMKCSDGEAYSQVLLTPVPVTLSGREYAAVTENIGIFAEAGFAVDDFGDGTVTVRECPAELTREDIPSLIAEIAGELLRGNTRARPERLERIRETAACRAAIKAGDSLKPEETYAFVRELLSNEKIRYCPHGRPVMYELSKHEIEKQFGRLG